MPKGTRASKEQIEQMRALRAEGMSVVQIASRVGLSTKTVGEHTSDLWKVGVSDSGRDRILRAVAEHGPLADMDEVSRLVPDIDIHSAMHLLYSLGKSGLVRFRENKNGSQTRLVAIEATKTGFVSVGLPAKPVASEVGRRTALSYHPGDGTDFHNQPSVAPGGPITRTTGVAAIVRIAPEPNGATGTAVEPAPAPVAVPPAFAAIRALRDRRQDLATAARLLESAGQEDLALQTLSKIDEYTALEQEALDLLALAIDAGIVTD